MNPDPEFFYDIQQGTPEWFEVRRGIPTASCFQTIIAGDHLKGYGDYLDDLAGEAMSGELTETFQSYAMARGKEMEAEVRDRFERRTMVDVRTVGFVRREIRPGRFVGCSPDALFLAGAASPVGFDSVLEIKTMKPRLMIRARRNGYDPTKCPPEHMAQVQGAMWVTNTRRAELVVWYRGMPFDLHYRIERDQNYITNLATAVIAFDRKLEAAVQESRSW